MTLVTLGLASYAEFEFRRKVGVNFRLPNVLPSSHRLRFEAKMAKDPPLRRANPTNEEASQTVAESHSEKSDSEVSNSIEQVEKVERVEEVEKRNKLTIAIDALLRPLEVAWNSATSFCANRGLEYFINLLFLTINYIHLLYLGSAFSDSDLSVSQTLHKYEQFSFISPILVLILLFYAHLL